MEVGPIETWLPIEGTDGYYDISDWGRSRTWKVLGSRYRKMDHPVILRQTKSTTTGYMTFGIHAGKGRGMTKTVMAHRCVAAAFIGPCPPGQEVAHGNGVRTDNHVSNLRYATRKDNLADMVLHGTHNRGENSPRAKMTEKAVIEIRRFSKDGWSQSFIGRLFGISQSTVSLIVLEKKWKYINQSEKAHD